MPRPEPTARSKALIPWALLGLSLSLTLAATLALLQSERERDRARFANAVQSAQDRIRARMDAYIALLYGARALFAGADSVSPDEFRAYVTQLDVQRRYPGVQGLGFTRRVPPGQVARLEAAMRAAGLPQFRVWPDTPRAEYHSIIFLEPRDQRNQAALGYDMYSEPTRRAAMARARDSGEPAMTGKVTLVQEIDEQKQPGFLIYLPVYRGGETPPTVAERRERLLGFVYAPFRAGDLFAGMFGSETAPLVTFRVFDGASRRAQALLHRYPLPAADYPRLAATVPLTVAGQRWTLFFRPTTQFGESWRYSVVGVLAAGGVLISLLLFSLTRTQARAQAEAEQHAAEAQALAAQLQEQAIELEQQVETAQALAEELEAGNEELRVAHERAQAARQEAERERSRAETERGRLAAIIAHAPVGIVIAEAPSGRIVRGNAMVERILRHPVLHSPDTGAYDEWVAFHPDGRRVEAREYPLARALAERRPVGPLEFLYQKGDGSRGWVQISGAPIRDSQGEVVAALAVLEDIDADKRAAQEREHLLRAIEVERLRLREVFEKAPAFMAVLRGPEHVFELVNPSFFQLVGHREILGRPVHQALPEVEGQGFFELLDRVYRSGEPFFGQEMPVRLQREPGAPREERNVDFVYQPMRDAEGRVTGLIAHGVDVTDQVRARRALEETSRAKSDFLATMSHELRTPLNAMLGYSELLLLGIPEAIPERAREQVERIRLSATHLLQIIEEILTFSRLEAGRERLDLSAVALGELAREVGAIIEPLAAAKGLGFAIDVPAPTLRLQTDARKVRQILLNLLGNAIKFTEAGQVTFAARTDGDGVVFQVHDSGIGIAPEHLERIFEPFWQVHSALHVRVGGTGLGLPVTRQLVELLGGSLHVESELHHGTTFTVHLPLELGPDGPARRP